MTFADSGCGHVVDWPAAAVSDAVSTDSPDIVFQIRMLLERHRAASLTVMFPVAVSDELILSLLEIPEIASVILAAAPVSPLDADLRKLGWLRADGRLARSPTSIGDLVLAIGDGEAFGFELAILSLKHGAKRIAFDSPSGFTEPRSLWFLLASRCWRGSNRTLRRKLRNAILSGKFGPLGPVLAKGYQRLERAIETRSFEKKFAHLTQYIEEAPISPRSVNGRWVVVTGSLGPGGAERQVVNSLQGIVKRGVRDIHLIAERLSPSPNDFYLPELEGLEGLSISEIGAVSARDDATMLEFATITQRAPAAFRMEILKLVAYFRQLRPEIVHAWQDGPCVKAGVAAVLAGVDRVILSWRTLSPLVSGLYQPSYRPIIQALAKRDNVIMLNNSAAGAQSYAGWLGFDDRRIQIIRNGVNFAALKRPAEDDILAYRDGLGLDASTPVVGTILRFSTEKRPMLWAETAAKVAERRPDVHFLMIGDGPLRQSVQSAVAAWGLEERIHMPGRMTNPGLALAAMDLFLLTSLYEGLPNVLIEAGVMGVPVISTDVGGVRETFIEGATGSAVRTNGASVLAGKLIEILDNESWRQEAGWLAPIWVKRRFAFERMIDETLEAYGADLTLGEEADQLDVA